MQTLMRYGMMGAVVYFGVNWVADNPAKVNHIRKQLNKSVEQGIERGTEILEEATK